MYNLVCLQMHFGANSLGHEVYEVHYYILFYARYHDIKYFYTWQTITFCKVCDIL